MTVSWDPKLAVGVALIDEQHKQLFAHVDALLEALHQWRGQQVVEKLLGFLKQYVVEHFTAEQRLMVQTGYPAFAEHERQHEEFVARFLDLEAEFQKAGATLGFTLKLNGVVCSWLRQHIATTDRALGAFVTQRTALRRAV